MAGRTNEELNVIIGRQLRKIREKMKVSQIELCRNLGIGKNQVNSVELGKSKASVELLLGYCKVLKVTPNELLGYKEIEHIPTDLQLQVEKLSDENKKIIKPLLDKLIERA